MPGTSLEGSDALPSLAGLAYIGRTRSSIHRNTRRKIETYDKMADTNANLSIILLNESMQAPH